MTQNSPWMTVRARWLATCLIFFALPLLLICVGFGRAWDDDERADLARVFADMDRALVHVRHIDTTERHLATLLRRIWQRIRGHERWPELLQAEVNRLRRRFGGGLHVVAIAGGDIPQPLSTRDSPRQIVKRMHNILLDVVRRERLAPNGPTPVPGDTDWKLVRPFVGPQAKATDLALSTRQFRDVSYLARRRWFMSIVEEQRALFFHAENTAQWASWALRDRCRIWGQRPDTHGINVGLIEAGVDTSQLPELQAALTGFRLHLARHQRYGDQLFALDEVRPGQILWAWTRCPASVSRLSQRLLLVTLGLAGFAVLAWRSYRTMVVGVPVRLPIRWRLLALFAFAGGLPVTVIIMQSWDYLNQVYRARVETLQQRNLVELTAFDQGFTRFTEVLGRRLTAVAEQTRFTPGPERDRLLAFFGRVWQRCGQPDIVIAGTRGELIWTAGPADETMARFRKVLSQVARLVLADIGKPEARMGSAGLANVETRSFFITDGIKAMGKLIEMRMASDPTMDWMLPLRADGPIPTLLAMAHWSRSQLAWAYVANALPRWRMRQRGSHLFAVDVNDPRRRYPARSALDPVVWNAVHESSRGGDVIHRIVPLAGRHWIVTALRTRQMAGALLVSMRPDDRIRAELAQGRRLLWAFIAIVATLSLMLGLSLAGTLLRPLRDLTKGVAAIEQRAFDHRVPIGETPELGAVAQLLNQVLGGLAELEVARLVQSSLFPAAQVRLGEFRGFGTSLPMTQLGGDYFDMQALPDGRLLLVIGDVSGHGVPAGLVMAMAKAVVIARLRRAVANGERLEPAQVLVSLQEVLFRGLQLRQMLTCLVGILDPATGTLDLANAGHSFPFLLRAGETPHEIRLPPSMPLANRRKAQFPVLSLSLQPGDRLLFYTDGFIEARDANGAQLGYERPFAAAAAIAGTDPQKWYEEILAWYRTVTQEAAQSDDVTLLMICRESAP